LDLRSAAITKFLLFGMLLKPGASHVFDHEAPI